MSADAATIPQYSVLHRFFETTSDLILVTDSKGVFLEISPSVQQILGYTQGEMIGHYGSDFMLPADLAATRVEMRLARKTGQHRQFMARYLAKDNSVVMFLWRGLWDPVSQKHYFIGRDISEPESFKLLKKLQDRLISLETFLPRYLPWRYSNTHLIELFFLLGNFWAAWVLMHSPSSFDSFPKAFALVRSLEISEPVWGVLALISALCFTWGNLWGIWRKDASLKLSYIPRLLGFSCSALFWLPMGVSTMIGNPDTLFGFLGFLVGTFSLWSVLRLSP